MAEEQQQTPIEVGGGEQPEPQEKQGRSREEEAAGPSGMDGRETAPDAETSDLGEHAYRGEVEQPRRPPADE